MKKISVIIPVYHPKKEYIDRLLDSIIRQTIGIENIEIIMVSDGDQTEETKTILSVWEEKYPDNIMLIYYEKNRKPGYARSLGIQYASGAFVAFADQDDWLYLHMYELLYGKALENNCEIAGGFSTRDFEYTYPKVGSVPNGKEEKVWDIQTEEERKYFLMHKESGGYWCSIYQRDFLLKNDLYFPSDLTFDDNFFGGLCMYYVNRMVVTGEYVYHWYVNKNSISMKVDSETYFDRLAVEQLKVNVLWKRGFFGKYKDEIEIHFLKLFYFNTMHAFFVKLNYIPFGHYIEMCKVIRERFPDYRNNPYLSSENEELKKYSWKYYPIVFNYFSVVKKDEEKIRMLESFPERVRKLSWLDTIDGDLTQDEIIGFRVVYLLLCAIIG